jgi:hypothetical protein
LTSLALAGLMAIMGRLPHEETLSDGIAMER